MTKSRDSINDVWGDRAPYYKAWSEKVDERTSELRLISLLLLYQLYETAGCGFGTTQEHTKPFVHLTSRDTSARWLLDQ